MLKFKVFHEAYLGKDFKEVEAFDEEHAAEIYAEEYDSDGDYPLAEGGVETIVIEDTWNQRKTFKISAAQTTVYKANEIE